MNRNKKWTVTGCLMWIIGLVLFIVGMNLSGCVKDWMMVAGSIIFMAGLGITGAQKKKKKKEEEADKK